MTKLNFILTLRDRLSALPESNIEEHLTFYIEMIEDRMEDGLSEEEAVAAIGNIDEIASQIIADTPLLKIAKEKIKPKRRLKTWEIVLIVLGAPVWAPLLIAMLALILSAYAVIWSLIAALWSVFVAVTSGTLAPLVLSVVQLSKANILSGFALFGASLFCAGISVFMFFACLYATKGTALITKKIALGIKNSFIKKEEA